MDSIADFLTRFEKDIAEEGVKQGLFQITRKIPIRPGKLTHKKFGKAVGSLIDSGYPFVVDYYGHCKKSRGFFEHAFRIKHETGVLPTMVKVPVVHFEAVKDKHFYTLIPDDPKFLGMFFYTKKELIRLRWQNNGK